ncbi:MAG TPA: hypothetical protein GX008_02465 [Firmicutes bacterium]|nr:hypothetical protein [Bacillota bacterium]
MLGSVTPPTVPPFAGECHYLGTFPKDGELYDYYEVTLDGKTTFVYVKAGEGEGDDGSTGTC